MSHSRLHAIQHTGPIDIESLAEGAQVVWHENKDLPQSKRWRLLVEHVLHEAQLHAQGLIPTRIRKVA